MTDPNPQHRIQVARAAIVSTVVCIALVAAGYGIAKAMGKPQHARDIAMAGGLVLLAGLPGLALAVTLTGKVKGGASLGFVAGVAVRLPVSGVIALYGLKWGLGLTGVFPQFVAGGYLLFLVVEVLCLMPAVKRTALAAPATPAPDTPPADVPRD